MRELSFGSDGFRGIIGNNFSWDVLARLTAATLACLQEQGIPKGAPVPVGFDARFLASHFAQLVYMGLLQGGMQPLLSTSYIPSPYLSFVVRKLRAPIGVMLTASHNPADYLGFKPKGPEGGSALPEVQARIAELSASVPPIDLDPYVVFSPALQFEHFDFETDYARTLAGQLAGEPLGQDFQLVLDFMHGSAASVNAPVLHRLAVAFTTTRDEPDPLFAGAKPEPVAANLQELRSRVLATGKKSIGAAFDGDGDRLGLIDEAGEILPNEDIFAICLLHLIEDRNQHGRIVKTVSFSSLIDRVAATFNLPVVEIPVGFKHATRELMVPGTLAAGEESGGIGFGSYLPERDALLTLLLVLEAMTMRARGLCEMRRELADRFGKSYFAHKDVPLVNLSQMEDVRKRMAELAASPDRVGLPDASPERLDGLKLRHKHGFLLIRLSGTEPILRIYCDDSSEGHEWELARRAEQFFLSECPN